MEDVKHPTRVIWTPEHESGEFLSPKCNRWHVLPNTLYMAKIVLGEKSRFAAIGPPQTSELQTASISLEGALVVFMIIQPSLLVLGALYGNSTTANRAILQKSCILSMSSNRHSARCCDFLRWSFVCSFGVPIVTQALHTLATHKTTSHCCVHT